MHIFKIFYNFIRFQHVINFVVFVVETCNNKFIKERKKKGFKKETIEKNIYFPKILFTLIPNSLFLIWKYENIFEII